MPVKLNPDDEKCIESKYQLTDLDRLFIENKIEIINPNWKIHNNYPDIKDTTLDEWAFRFMVRGEGYLADVRSAIENADFLNHDAQINRDEVIGAVLKRYGLDHNLVDKFDWQGYPLTFKTHPVRIDNMTNNKTDQTGMSHLEFDLNQPISPQINKAKKFLISEQKKLNSKLKIGKAIIRLFPFYLRVLDAVAAGESDKNMCDTLSRNYEKGVDNRILSNWKKEANRLRDGGYLDLVKKPEP